MSSKAKAAATQAIDFAALTDGLTGTFNLSELYDSLDDPRIETDMKAAEQAVEQFVEKWGHGRVDYMENPVVLLEALTDYEHYTRHHNDGAKAQYYVKLRIATESGNSDVKKLKDQLQNRAIAMGNKMTFFALNLGKISADNQKVMLDSPLLAEHHETLRVRFDGARYDLSDEGEQIVNMLMPHARDNWKQLVVERMSLSTATLPGKKERVPFNALSSLLPTTDKVLAANVIKASTRIKNQHASLAAEEVNNIVAARTKVLKLRGYDRVEGPSLRSSGLTAEILDSMLAMCDDNISAVHDVYRLLADLFGVEQLDRVTMSMPYGKLPTGYTFAEASELVYESYTGLHPSFGREFVKALKMGRFDWIPRAGKRGGACCWDGALDHPSYLLMNFNGSLSNVTTLAHEGGHYLNNVFIQKGGRCNSLNYDVSIPRAEVASMFQEPFVIDLIMREVDDETRLAMMVDKLLDSVGSIFFQAMGTRFEQDIYGINASEGFLDKQRLNALFMEHYTRYAGPAVAVDNSRATFWVIWSQLRRGFYNYGYTFAELVSKAMRERVLMDPGWIEQVIYYLEVGGSVDTQTLLDSLGLNVRDGSVWSPGIAALRRDTANTRALAVKLGKL